MSKLKQLLERFTGKDGRGEADVVGDPARADSRETSGGEYVGRIADDEDFSGETGAERRAED
jgi:hypothetical protein